jgi:hypothetical protein
VSQALLLLVSQPLLQLVPQARVLGMPQALLLLMSQPLLQLVPQALLLLVRLQAALAAPAAARASWLWRPQR